MVTERDVVDYYDRIYQKKGVNSMRPYPHYRGVLRYLGNLLSDSRLLDVGCGTGHFLKAASELGLDVYGIDISSQSVKVAKENVPKANIAVGPGESLPYHNGFFDYIICGGSLEHFLDMDKGIDEMIRVASPNARFMIIVPNKNYFLWKFRKEYGTKQQDLKETLMTLPEWQDFFVKHGLNIEKVYHDPWPWQSLEVFKYKNPWRILRRMIYRVVWMFVPISYTYQFVFILSKKS
jgi:ubiquinone/menaquinone biosynthesis C-methylase UbiE